MISIIKAIRGPFIEESHFCIGGKPVWRTIDLYRVVGLLSMVASAALVVLGVVELGRWL